METETTTNVPSSEMVPRPLPKSIELLKNAWEIFKKRASDLLTISFISILATSLPTFLMGVLGRPEAGVPSVSAMFALLGLMILFVIGVYVAIWGQLAMLWTIKHHETDLGIKDAYIQSHSKLLSYIWVMILSVLITVTGMLLFIVPGIIISVWFSLAIFILISGEEKGLNALLKSKEYVRGHWWQFLRYIVVVAVLGLLVSLVALIVEYSVTQYAAEVTRNMFSIFMTPFVLAYSYCMYVAALAQKPGMPFVANPKHRTIFTVAAVAGILIPLGLILAIGSFMIANQDLLPAMQDAVLVETDLIDESVPEN